MIRTWLNTLMRRIASRSPHPSSSDHLDEYVTSTPTSQNAIDTLKGWNQAFPAQFGVSAGDMHLHNDPRIAWAIQKSGSLAGKRIMEVGPLEAWHTYMLEQQQPALIDAVEANRLSFLRCLVVKEIVGLKRTRFHLGDAQLWLEERPERYDLIVASGVLYHMQDPVRFLKALAARTDQIFLWTHYVDDNAMPPGDPRRGAFVNQPETLVYEGVNVVLYPRTYLQAWKSAHFCGGMHDIHRWMDRTSLLALLKVLGFDEIEIWGDEPQHAFGPACCIFARRSPSPS